MGSGHVHSVAKNHSRFFYETIFTNMQNAKIIALVSILFELCPLELFKKQFLDKIEIIRQYIIVNSSYIYLNTCK